LRSLCQGVWKSKKRGRELFAGGVEKCLEAVLEATSKKNETTGQTLAAGVERRKTNRRPGSPCDKRQRGWGADGLINP